MPASLDVLIISDGRPGHYNLSEGIVLALGRLSQTVVRRLEVRRGRWPGRVTGWMTNAGLSPRATLRAIYGLTPDDVPPADVIVSAGAETLAASVAIARLRRIPNIHYGSLRNYDARGFSLVLTSYAERAQGPPLAFVAKPGRFDPDEFGPPSDPSTWMRGLPRTMGLAIGGDTSGCRWTTADWDGLFETVTALADQGVSWLASNSRRTSPEISERAAELARSGLITAFVDVREPDAPRLWDLFRDVDALLVTADSSSMVSEAVFARRPVIAVSPAGMRLSDDEASYRRWLSEHERQTTLPADHLDADAVLAALRTLRPETGNPLHDLARLIADRVPQLAPQTP